MSYLLSSRSCCAQSQTWRGSKSFAGWGAAVATVNRQPIKTTPMSCFRPISSSVTILFEPVRQAVCLGPFHLHTIRKMCGAYAAGSAAQHWLEGRDDRPRIRHELLQRGIISVAIVSDCYPYIYINMYIFIYIYINTGMVAHCAAWWHGYGQRCGTYSLSLFARTSKEMIHIAIFCCDCNRLRR